MLAVATQPALAQRLPDEASAQGAAIDVVCEYVSLENVHKYAIFRTSTRSDLGKFVREHASDALSGIGCTTSKQDTQRALEHVKMQADSGQTWTKLDWSPDGWSASSPLLRRSVYFRSPHDDERGYSGVTFDVEYQLLVCEGELHLAYSLVEDSVRIGHLPTASASDTAHYTYDGHYYRVKALPAKVINLPLKGLVFWKPYESDTIGTFADDHVGKALGFGCFSGQTQKIADMSSFKAKLGKDPSKADIAKLLDRMDAAFQTNEVLTSDAAEEEINAGLAKAADEAKERSGEAAVERAAAERDARRRAAEEREARKAAEEAEFQAKQAAYEQGMAEHKAAVEQYQKSLAEMEAQKAANAAAARAQQEEFDRKQAEYEAEAARARQAQADYEATYGKPQ